MFNPVLAQQEKWTEYMNSRTGTYEYRCKRYSAVYLLLQSLGLGRYEQITDVGAGACEFDKFLRTETPFEGKYVPVDGALTGIDLETWEPDFYSDWFVAIETIEHVNEPFRLLEKMFEQSHNGVVITTPNPLVVDVFEMDATHKAEVYEWELRDRGFEVVDLQLFDTPADSLLAWRSRG